MDVGAGLCPTASQYFRHSSPSSQAEFASQAEIARVQNEMAQVVQAGMRGRKARNKVMECGVCGTEGAIEGMVAVVRTTTALHIFGNLALVNPLQSPYPSSNPNPNPQVAVEIVQSDAAAAIQVPSSGLWLGLGQR